MNSGNNNFNVPTLTLSSYRSKKNYGASIPTHDYSQKTSNYINNNQQNIEDDNTYKSIIANNVYKKQ
jgi:hypothetical protein